MTATKDQAQTLFLNALELPSAEKRAAYLDAHCGAESELRKEIDELLDHARRLGPFLEPADKAADCTTALAITERPGTIIGPYKLLQQIGEGGMGIVFMAEQSEPIQRTVALKIIKPGMDTRQVIARFEAERQAVAMMDHSNIAKVLDAGTTDSGRPFFVMELVKGIAITKYCDEKQLPLRERLELFVPVCQAVQHAHQKGVIHRDLKPNNVLVAECDNQSVPKVIDFGVAKATGQKLTERTMFTEFGQVVGTLEYMSPEQAKMNQLDVDTRSDVYSLGVLLYELLTGSTPFERKRLNEAAFDEMLRIIREEEPPTPSTKLSSSDTLPSVAANRHSDPSRLSKDVRGELDWIVMKCLEKDRNRRYESASAVAQDVYRYMADEPVQACPPSAAYRFRKFARRNKAALMTTASVLTFVLVGSVVSSLLIWNAYKREVQARTAEASERQRAEANLKVALDALDAVLLRHAEDRFSTDPDPRGLDSDVMQKGLQFYEQVAARHSDDPAVQLAAGIAYERVSLIQSQLGEVGKADAANRRAIAIFENLPAGIARSPECRRHLTVCYVRQGFRLNVYEKESAFRRAIAVAEGLVADYPNTPQHWHLLGISQSYFGDHLARNERVAESEAPIRRALEAFERISDQCAKTPEYQMARARTYSILQEFLSRQSRSHEAEQACRQALALEEQVARDFPQFAWQRQHGHTLRYLAFTIWPLGRLEEAEAAYADAAKLFQQLASEFPNVPQHRHFEADSYRSMGDIQTQLNHLEQAEESYSKAIKVFESLPDDFISTGFVTDGGDPQLADAWQARGDTYLQRGEFAKAASDFAKALALKPDLELSIGHRYHDFGGVQWTKGRLQEAEQAFREALFRKQKAVDASPLDPSSRFHLAHTHMALAGLLRETGKQQEAATQYRDAVAIAKSLTAEPADNLDFAKLLDELQQKEKDFPESDKSGR